MKTTILLFVFGLFSVAVLHAQIEKGRVQIGGSAGVGYQNYVDSLSGFGKLKSTSFNISPSVGVFYKTNKMYGVFLNFSYSESTYNFAPKYVARGYGGGVFFRQYQSVAKKLYLLLDERASYFYQSSTQTRNLYHNYTISTNTQTGMAYDVAKRMQLEVLLNNLLYAGYQHSKQADSYSIGTSLDGFTLSNVAFGFRFYMK